MIDRNTYRGTSNSGRTQLLAATGQHLERKRGNLSLTPFAPTNPERINSSSVEPCRRPDKEANCKEVRMKTPLRSTLSTGIRLGSLVPDGS